MSETTRTYELGYLIVPTVPEAQIDTSVEGLTTAITAAGGTIVATGAPEFIDLAYVMEKSVASKISKYSQGYFGWVKFDADPDAVEALKKTLDANMDLIRFLLTKTSAQNMVIFKKPKNEAVRESQTDDFDELLAEDAGDDELTEDHEKLPDLEDEVNGAILGETEGTQASPEAAESDE